METAIIKHVYGNPLHIAIPLTEKIRTIEEGHEVEHTEDFYPHGEVEVVFRSDIRKYEYIATMDGNVAIIKDDKGDVIFGNYAVIITCFDQDGKPRRFATSNAIKIVNYTADAGIRSGIEFNAETYTLEGAVFFYAKGDKGDKGDQGIQGEQGIQGVQGIQGEKGEKGDKGDPFTYEDFTPTQIEELQKPAVDAAHMVDETLANYISPEPIIDITDIL